MAVGNQREFQRSQFLRAIEARKVDFAWQLAREMPEVSRADALALVFLLAEQDDGRFSRAAGRWGKQWIADHGGDQDGDQLVLAALGALRSPLVLAGIAALSEACERRGEHQCVELCETWRPRGT